LGCASVSDFVWGGFRTLINVRSFKPLFGKQPLWRSIDDNSKWGAEIEIPKRIDQYVAQYV